MKKRKIGIVLVIAMCISMVVCGCSNTPHGVYKNDYTQYELEFSGNNVRFILSNDDTIEGTFEMDENVVVVTFDNGQMREYIWNKGNDTLQELFGKLFYEKK